MTKQDMVGMMKRFIDNHIGAIGILLMLAVFSVFLVLVIELNKQAWEPGAFDTETVEP